MLLNGVSVSTENFVQENNAQVISKYLPETML
jgi:hypothetical protein